jgi:hypothetical protein
MRAQLTDAERLEAARMGKAHRPYFVVTDFSATRGGTVSGTTGPVDFVAPLGVGQPDFFLVLYSLLTDIGGAQFVGSNIPPFANILTRRRVVGGVVTEEVFNTPARLEGLIAGSCALGDERYVPAEWFDFPEPIPLRPGQKIDINAQSSTGAAIDLNQRFAVWRGERVFTDGSAEAQLSETEKTAIQKQITTRPRRTFITTANVNMNGGTNAYENIEFPDFKEWALILAFASVTASLGSAQYLQSGLVGIKDPNGYDWHNALMPLAALMGLLFDPDDTHATWRPLLTPYLVGPGRKAPTFTFSARGGSATPDNAGKISALCVTV